MRATHAARSGVAAGRAFRSAITSVSGGIRPTTASTVDPIGSSTSPSVPMWSAAGRAIASTASMPRPGAEVPTR